MHAIHLVFFWMIGVDSKRQLHVVRYHGEQDRCRGNWLWHQPASSCAIIDGTRSHTRNLHCSSASLTRSAFPPLPASSATYTQLLGAPPQLLGAPTRLPCSTQELLEKLPRCRSSYTAPARSIQELQGSS